MIVETVLAVYLVAVLLVGIYEYRRTKGIVDYYLAGKRLGTLIVSFSFFATYFSTAAFLGGGGAGFIMGFQWSAFLTFFHILFAILAWMFIATPMKRIADKHGALTIPELFRIKLGSLSQIIAAVIIIVFFEFYMVSIYKGAGNLFQVMLSIDYTTGLLITALVVTIYTAIGGFRAVVMTDLIQGIIVLVGGVALFATLIYTLGGIDAAIQALSNTKIFGGMSGEALFEFGRVAPPPIMKSGMVIPFILSLTFAISVAQLASPQLVVRFIAARDERVIAHGMILTPLIIGIFAICVFSIGPFGWLVIPKYTSDITPFLKDTDLVVPFIAMKLFPVGINALLLTAIVAAAMSTINSLVHVVATAFVRDLLQNIKRMPENLTLNLTRASVFLFALLPVVFAVKPMGQIVEIVGVSFSVITSAFLVPLMASLYFERPNPLASSASMIAAVITCVLWYVYLYKTFWIYPVVPGLVVSLLVYVTFSLALPKPSRVEV
ncbi:sodium:solute symporter family transporter [Archaeoglobus neptunius]|uniref:sodium:solute symporter family transporter n=1 Tax=Archaeoglobus neptunius TaxID=2798580 RepID=UPI0019263AAE|nr:sodium/solute symporter [Archaeoglobus neptunius]